MAWRAITLVVVGALLLSACGDDDPQGRDAAGTIVYAALFAVSVAALFAFIYWSTIGYLERQTDAVIQAEVTGLREQAERRGLIGLIDVIDERVDRGRRATFLEFRQQSREQGRRAAAARQFTQVNVRPAVRRDLLDADVERPDPELQFRLHLRRVVSEAPQSVPPLIPAPARYSRIPATSSDRRGRDSSTTRAIRSSGVRARRNGSNRSGCSRAR